MKTRVLVLGAGFGGLELTTRLSDALGGDVSITLIDKSDSFVFGSNAQRTQAPLLGARRPLGSDHEGH